MDEKKREQSPVYTMEDGSKMHYVDGVKFPCRFCGLDVMVGEQNDGNVSAMHVMPMCENFEKMDPLEFLVSSRKFYENLN